MDSRGSVLESDEPITVLEEADWRERERIHHETVVPWIEAYCDRRARGETHPVRDFLLSYYQTKRKTLKDWRPACGEALRGESADRFLEDGRYLKDGHGVHLDRSKLVGPKRERVAWVKRLLELAADRAPRFGCFGLHEWAMVYKSDSVRHDSTPLRIDAKTLESVVEGIPIRCTHFDAFRFFTPQARPLNALQPGREDRERFEQFGCVHFNMDLYRWCYKLCPWIGADLMRACFLLASQARELDMRASPYDLREYGYTPVCIETAEGRDEYAGAQQEIFRLGQPLARRLRDECAQLLV